MISPPYTLFPSPPMSHPHTKLLDHIDELPVMKLRQLKTVLQVLRDERHGTPQDLLKEYTPGEMIHGHVSLFNVGMNGCVEVKSLFVVMEGSMEYQRMNGERVKRRVLRMDMDVVETIRVPSGTMFSKKFMFAIPDQLIGKIGEEEVLVGLPPTLGNRGDKVVVGEEGFAIGNGMGGPVILDDLSGGALVEYKIRCIAIGVHGAVVGETEYPVRIVPDWRRSDVIAGRSTSVGQLMRKVKSCVNQEVVQIADAEESFQYGEVHREIESMVNNWGVPHRVNGVLSMVTVKSKSVGYSTATRIQEFNGINGSSTHTPIILHFTGPTPPKVTCIKTRLQVHTITSSSCLPLKIQHHHLPQLEAMRHTFAQYQQHLVSLKKACPHLVNAVKSLSTLEKRCITTEFSPLTNTSQWMKNESGWTMTTELSALYNETLVPDFQLESFARLYMVEIVAEMKKDRVVMYVPLKVKKSCT